MHQPNITPRVEKLNDLARVGIHGGNVRAFPPVAVETGEGKIFHDRGPTVLGGNHMIWFVRHQESFRKQAVFAMVFGSGSDLIAQNV